MEQRLIILFTGIIAVSVFDAAGSIISRKFKINYSMFSMISLFIYIAIGCFSAMVLNKITGMTMAALVGLFDAVIGWKICLALKADFGEYEEVLTKEIEQGELGILTVVFLTLFSGLLGWFGTFLSQFFI